MLAHHLLLHITYVLAGGSPGQLVPNPAPTSPVSSSGVNTLLGYAKWGSLASCAASAVASGGMLAVGHLSSRPEVSDKGKRALLWSLGGAAVVALAIPVLDTIFSSVTP